MQPGVSLTDEQAAFPPAHRFNPFHSLHADMEGLLPEASLYGAESSAHHPRAASASPLQSGTASGVFASEPSTPTGASLVNPIQVHDSTLDGAHLRCAKPTVNASAIAICHKYKFPSKPSTPTAEP